MANKPEVAPYRPAALRLAAARRARRMSGPRTFRALVTNCGGVGAALKALPELARRGGAKRPIRVASVEEVEKELDRRPQARRALRRPWRAGLSAGAAGDRFRAAASRSSGPRRGVAQAGGRDRRLAQRLRCGTHIRRAAGARPGTSRLCRRLGAGAGDRSARPCREPGDRRRRRARWRTWKALSERGRAADGADGRIRRGPVRNAGRVGAARARLSAPQSHRLRTGARGRRGRGGAGLGLAHHRAIRARTEPSGVRRARLSPRSARRRNQRSPEAGGVDLHQRGRRADGARANALAAISLVMREAGGEPASRSGGNKRCTGSIRNRRLERGSATNSTTRRSALQRPATKPRPRASGSSPCSALRQSRSTNWLGPRRLRRGRCGWRCSNSNWPGASNIRATASPCARPPTKSEPHGGSIERIARVRQSNRSFEGLLLVARARLRRRRWCEHKSRFPPSPFRGNRRAGRGGPRSPWPRAGRSCR